MQNIAGRCQQTFKNNKLVDITQQCFALLPQVSFPAHNLNIYWRWRWWDPGYLLKSFLLYHILLYRVLSGHKIYEAHKNANNWQEPAFPPVKMHPNCYVSKTVHTSMNGKGCKIYLYCILRCQTSYKNDKHNKDNRWQICIQGVPG